MELFMKYPHEVQEELLHNLLSKAQQTEMGMRYNFEAIKNYEDFRSQVPLSNYESVESQIERCRQGVQNIFWPTPIKWFAKSSGTTNAKSKFIPVSVESLEDCHYKAGKDMLSCILTIMKIRNYFLVNVCVSVEVVNYTITTTVTLEIFPPSSFKTFLFGLN